MGDITYTPAPYPFLSDVLLSWEMKSVVEDYAEQVLNRARAIAPYDDGDYVASLQVDVVTNLPFTFGPRVVGIAEATAPHAVDVEARHKVMMRAAGG